MEQSDHHLARIALQVNQSQVREPLKLTDSDDGVDEDWAVFRAIDFVSNVARKKQIDASHKELLDIS
jgi:hypothetical protein